MTRQATRSTLRSTALWLAAAAIVWLTASAVDRRTIVTIDAVGDHIRFDVAGTELVVAPPTAAIDAVSLWMADSIDPPRLIEWTVTRGTDKPIHLPSPLRPGRRDGDPAPIGDWWADDRCPVREISRHELSLVGDFRMRLVFRGRFANETSVTLDGVAPLHCSFRRGLKDNYLVIRDGDHHVIAATTLAPTPAADLRALAAQLLRAAAAGSIAVGVTILLVVLLGGRSAPSDATHPAAAIRRWAVPATVVLAAAAAAVSAWTGLSVLGGLPHQIDEVVDLLQARWLLDGSPAPPISTIQDHLRVPLTYVVDGRWVGHYPIGWPALLAVGLAAGSPHLVNPVLSAVLVVLTFALGRRIDDELTGLSAAAAVAASPLARVIGGSLLAHSAAAVLVATAILLALRSRNGSHLLSGAGIGLALACCLAVRPLTAVVVALAVGGWLLAAASVSGHRSWAAKTLGAAFVVGAAGSMPTLLVNRMLTGSAVAFPYSLAAGPMYDISLLPFGIRNLDAIVASASASLFGWGWPVAVCGLALALPMGLALAPALLRRVTTEDLLLLAVVVLFAVGHLPTRAHGLHGYGARYIVDIAPCCAVLVARGVRELARRARPSPAGAAVVWTAFCIAVATTLALLPMRLDAHRGYYGVTGELKRQLAATGHERAVVLVPPEGWKPWAEAAPLMTGPRRLDIIFAADLGDNSVLTAAYPDRPVLRWDGVRLLGDDGGGD